MTDLEQEVDQLFIDYFRDFSNLDLNAIVAYFHLPCVFIVPQDLLAFSTYAEVEAFWAPRFADMRAADFGHTERHEASIQVLNDNTAMASSLAVRFTVDGTELERRGAAFACRKTEFGWKIATVIHHPPDNVIKMH
jgi:ketosteroid isomerase-like protein